MPTDNAAAWDRHAVDGAPRHAIATAPRVVEAAPADPARQAEPDAAIPTCVPHRRDPATVAPAGTYQRHDQVWVYREGAWRPGLVESASHRAVMATYRRAAGPGLDPVQRNTVRGGEPYGPRVNP